VRNLLPSASPLGAPPRRFLALGPCEFGRTGAFAPLIPRDFARVRHDRVLPLKAIPRSRDGRRPKTPRGWLARHIRRRRVSRLRDKPCSGPVKPLHQQNASGGALAERDCGGCYRFTVAKTRLSAAATIGQFLATDALKSKREIEEPNMVEQNGSANFAVAILNRPWRQRFQEQGGPRACFQGSGSYAPTIMVAPRVSIEELQSMLLEITQ